MGSIELAGFTIDGLLGRGGMADVWRGRHRGSGQPAAIKVIARDRADDRGFVEGLRREVRAVAGLDHPGIVPVLDAGTVPRELSDAGLTPGSPWLAMVLAEHGDLSRLGAPLPWPLLRDVLLQILDGLAHAHARDVIHRDLKPGNVLLQLDDGRLRVMLTDFGIAHVFDPQATPEAGHSLGTPAYMAPEQLRGQWRDFGPWTDLYALGCMAFELAGGAAPYTGTAPLAIATRHLTGEIPRLRLQGAVPPGFIGWVRRLMSREWWARPRTAAEAARALSRLPAPPPDAERAALADAARRLTTGQSDGPETEIDGSLARMASTTALAPTLAVAVTALETAHAGQTDDAEAPAPIPETWYVDRPRRPLLAGVGLGLFGVRAQPLMGREAERNRLWDALRRVAAKGRAELMLLRGEEGVGRTALAEWLARRAHELGAAEVVRFRFGAMDGAGDGLADGLEAFFRGHGLARPALVERIRATLTRRAPADARMIDDLVAPSLARLIRGADVSQSSTERNSALSSGLRLMAQRRPLVVLLDDLHWDVESMQLVEWLLERGLDAPVLIVGTVDPARSIAERRRRDALERLSRRARPIELAPLDAETHHRAMRGLLGLSPRLSAAVLERAAGNPLFTRQIVADWVEQRALRPTPDGYALPPGRAPDVPRDLGDLAGRRIARVAPDDQTRRALHVAAALGHAVHRAEWQAACAALGVTPSPTLEGDLEDAGLATRAPDGWVFAHGFVRTALIESGAASGHWAAVHRACADAVHIGISPAERRAWHLIEAEATVAAIDALLDAAQAAMDRADYRRALRLLDIRVQQMDRAGLAADDVRRAQGMASRVNGLRFSRDPEGAKAAMVEFEAFPIGPRHPGLMAERARVRAGLLAFNDDFRAHFDAYNEAVELFRVAGDVRGEARALHGLGWNQITQGHFARAATLMIRSRDLARSAGLRLDEGWANQGLATARYFGGLGGEDEALREAQRAFAEVRFPIGTAMVLADLADYAVLSGDLTEARRQAEASSALFEGAGSQLVFRTRVTLATLTLYEGRPREALAAMIPLLDGDALDGLPRLHRYGMAIYGAAMALYADDDDRFERWLAIAESDPSRRFMAATGRQLMLRVIATLEERGRVDDAARVLRLLADYTRLVDPAEAERLRARADALVEAQATR